MSSAKALARRTSTAVIAALFVCAAALPILINKRAYAAQMTERSIDLSTSKVSATDVTHVVSFKAATNATIQGIVVDYCTSPLVDTACVTPTGFNINETTLAFTAGSNTGSFAIDAASDTNTVIITNAAGPTPAVGDTVAFTLGTTAANDGLTNPSTNGSFYARIVTYSTVAAAQGYVSDNVDAVAAPVDAGGIAMSTANQLTVSARVQEVLTFCVGTDDRETTSPGTKTDDCADISGTVVDLGVVQSGSPNISPVSTVNGGNGKDGWAMIRTNAVNGVVVDYFAEPVSGDTGSQGYAGGMGSLRVSGTTCTGTGTLASGDMTDQCFNSAGLTRTHFTPTQEGFGMTISEVVNSGSVSPNGTTSNLARDTQYAGDGSNNAGTGGWAWSETSTDTIASSMLATTKVVDDEMLRLRFAAQAAVTTPTGQYGVTSTYIATSSF